MGYIAANRYLKILHPRTPHCLQIARGSRLVSSLTWLVLGVCGGVYVGVSLLSSRSRALSCSLNCDSTHSPKKALFHVIIHSCLLVLFLCVLLALLFFYTSISCRLTETRRRRPQSNSSRNLHRAQRNTLLLLLVFSVCFVPYHTMRLTFALLRRRHNRPLYLLKEASVLLAALNLCLDPLLYLLFSRAFRTQLSLKRIRFGAADSSANANTTSHANSNEARSGDAQSCDAL